MYLCFAHERPTQFLKIMYTKPKKVLHFFSFLKLFCFIYLNKFNSLWLNSYLCQEYKNL